MPVADLVSLIVALSPITAAALYQIGASQRNNKTCDTKLAIARALGGRLTAAAISQWFQSSIDIPEKTSAREIPAGLLAERLGDQEVRLPPQAS